METEYQLHFTQSGYDILVLDMIFNNTDSYGAVDYVVLYEKGVVRAYISTRGKKEAYIKGSVLLKDTFFRKLLIDSQTLRKKLRAYSSSSHITDTNALVKWKKTKALNSEFNRVYHYYEQPFQSALEEKVLESISEQELFEALSDTAVCEKIEDPKVKKYLKRLITLGNMKLKIHQDAEKFVSGNGMGEFIAKKYDISLHLVNAMRMEEFENVLKERTFSVSKKELEQRCEGSVFIKRRGVWKLYTQDTYQRWKRKIQGIPRKKKKILGRVAFPGKARGRVVTHLSWVGTTDVKKGDILVCGMTNPQMIPFIKKASAIITDEGGLTCHAAIIAREMKKPCIVGTKIATQALQSGDRVEVDANEGVVHLLKKKKTRRK